MSGRPLPLLALIGALYAAPAPALDLDAVPNVPRAEALRSPDGSFLLTIYAPVDWIAAEVEVRGGDGVDLGAAALDQAVQVRGATSRKGNLDITLSVATKEKVGITWEFDVAPTAVPSRSPELRRADTPRKKGKR